MTDNIKSKHYRTGEIDIYEWWYLTYPFEQYRVIMQATAERYMRIDESDCVENLDEAIYALECLKEKEIEHAKKDMKTPEEAFGGINFDEWLRKQKYDGNIYLLKGLLERDCEYLARDKNEELWVYDTRPIKLPRGWTGVGDRWGTRLGYDNFPEVKWSDEKPTKISDLLATYEIGGENGK